MEPIKRAVPKKKCNLIDNPAPNPKNFHIIWSRSEQIGSYTVLLVSYPDCKNFEGYKVLVYKGAYLEWFKELKELDPHFSERGLSPIARFAPTAQGQELAKKMCYFMMSIER